MNTELAGGLQFGLAGHSVLVRDQGVSGEFRRLEIGLDEKTRDELVFLRYYSPRYMMGGSGVAFWAGSRLYFLDVETGCILQLDRDDEIHEVYFLEALWCLRGETTVSFFDPITGKETKWFEHNEVITESWLEANELVLRDFNARVIRLDLPESPTPS